MMCHRIQAFFVIAGAGCLSLLLAGSANAQAIKLQAAADLSRKLGSLESDVRSMKSKVDALERANQDLKKQLSRSKQGASGDGAPRKRDMTLPGLDRKYADRAAPLVFRASVLEALKPELDEIRSRDAKLEDRADQLAEWIGALRSSYETHLREVHIDYMRAPPLPYMPRRGQGAGQGAGNGGDGGSPGGGSSAEEEAPKEGNKVSP